MEDTTVSVIGILIASIIMFIVPLILIADRSDDISQLIAQTATSEFVDEVIKSGKITAKRYQEFVNALASSGNTFEIDMEVKILDENTSKIVTDADVSKIGTNSYYSIYTSQIEEKIAISGTEDKKDDVFGVLALKQGDKISVTVRNESATLSQLLKSFYYNASGSDIHIIAATGSGIVAVDGITSIGPSYISN